MSPVSNMFFPSPTEPSSHSHWDGRASQFQRWPSRPFNELPPKIHTQQPLAYSAGYDGWIGGVRHHELPGPIAPTSFPSPSSSDTSYSSVQSQSQPLSRRLPNHSSSSASNVSFKRTTTMPASYVMNPPEYYFGNALYAPSVHPVSYSPTSFDRIAESTPSSPEAMAGSKRTFCVKKISSPRHLQCWDHGCNGRAFSTSSNLLRHQREKAGRVAKTHCPHCDAAFTRTTARNMHVVKGVCRINPLQ